MQSHADETMRSAAAPQVRLRVRCFGGLFVDGPGGWEPSPSPKRGGELLQYLVAYPRRSFAREALIETFWPDSDRDSAAHRLHMQASGTRQFLKRILAGFDALSCIGGTYAWHPGLSIDSDVARFTALLRDGATSAFEQALELYRGDFLAGVESEWVQPLRVQYAANFVSAMERLAERAFAANNLTDALAYGLELVSVDRAHEGASRLVIRTFAALGRRGSALAEYEALRRHLRTRLGLQPTLETTRLIDSIAGGGEQQLIAL